MCEDNAVFGDRSLRDRHGFAGVSPRLRRVGNVGKGWIGCRLFQFFCPKEDRGIMITIMITIGKGFWG